VKRKCIDFAPLGHQAKSATGTLTPSRSLFRFSLRCELDFYRQGQFAPVRL